MVRTTTRDDESRAEASVSAPDYRLTGVDLVDVSEGDRITFTTTTKRSNGVPLRNGTTLTVDDVTVTEEESTEMVEVEPEWLPDDGMFGCDDDVASATVPRDVIETHVEVVGIDDGTRYTLRQTDTGFVNVSSCDQSDFVDRNERGEWNAVARSNVSHGVLKSWSHDEVVTDGGVDLPDVGDRFVDTRFDRIHEVTDVDTRQSFSDDEPRTVVVYDNDTVDYAADFRDDRDAGHLVPVADTATETAARVFDAKGDDVDPFDAAVNEPMNDADRHLVRFVATRDDGVDFDFATGLAEWFEPDRIVAEHYDVVDEVRDALAVLREHADGRTVSAARVGSFEVDPDTGDVVAVKLFESSFDVLSGTHDDVASLMLSCFDAVDDVEPDDDAYGCRVVAVDDDGFAREGPEDDPDDPKFTPGDRVFVDFEGRDEPEPGTVDRVKGPGGLSGNAVYVVDYDDGGDAHVDYHKLTAATDFEVAVDVVVTRTKTVTIEAPDAERAGQDARDAVEADAEADADVRVDDVTERRSRDDPDDDVELITDGGRPPLSSFDHAPTIDPADVDKCRECGRYAPHRFDHAPDCSAFEPIDDELSSRTAASNPRMVRPKADGGTPFDTDAQSPERIASDIVAAEEGDGVVIQTGGDDLLAIYQGDVVSTGYKEAPGARPGGTHVVAVRAGDVRVAVHFERTVGDDWEISEPEPVVFDPQKGRTTAVTRFDRGDA